MIEQNVVITVDMTRILVEELRKKISMYRMSNTINHPLFIDYPALIEQDAINVQGMFENYQVPLRYTVANLRNFLEQYIEFLRCNFSEEYTDKYFRMNVKTENTDILEKGLEELRKILSKYMGSDRYEEDKSREFVSTMCKNIDEDGNKGMLYNTYLLLSDMAHNSYYWEWLFINDKTGRLKKEWREVLIAIFGSILQTVILHF